MVSEKFLRKEECILLKKEECIRCMTICLKRFGVLLHRKSFSTSVLYCKHWNEKKSKKKCMLLRFIQCFKSVAIAVYFFYR